MIPQRVVSPAEAAQSLGLSERAVYTELQANRLRSFKSGRRRLIPVAALDEWVALHEREEADRKANLLHPRRRA